MNVIPIHRTSTISTEDHLKNIIETQAILASSQFELDIFMNTMVERVQALTSASGAVIEFLENDEMLYRAASGTIAKYVGLRIKMKGSLSGLCVEKGELMIASDTSTDPRVDAAACKKNNALSMVVVPLSRQHKVVGVIKVVSQERDAFNYNDIQTLQLMAGLLGGALGQQQEIERRKEIEEQLVQMAQNDSLTGIPNGTLFNDRLTHALSHCARHDYSVALMYMDIDYFKQVNDTHGHPAGDALLKAFVTRTLSVIRASDTIARLGGDEFTLIAENLRSPREAEIIALKILEATRKAFHLKEHNLTLHVTASIGIAVVSGAHINARELINRADKALYDAKKHGRDCFQFAPAL